MFHIQPSIMGFERLIRLFVALPLYGNVVYAAECSNSPPDYTARRVLTIGQETKISKVYVSGFKVREEGTSGDGRQPFMLRLPEQGVSYLVDPARKEALTLPLPPPPNASAYATKHVVDKRLDGTVVRRFQILSGGEWRDLSTTTCRADGVLLEQQSTMIDPQGKVVTASLKQSDIAVGTLPKTLFEVPKSVAIKDPPAQTPPSAP